MRKIKEHRISIGLNWKKKPTSIPYNYSKTLPVQEDLKAKEKTNKQKQMDKQNSNN